LAVLLAVAPSPCLALISVEDVSKARAKELGIEVRAKPNGPKEAWIELEFKPAGVLNDFNHVSLEIAVAGKFQLGWTPLKHERTSTGTVVVRLMGNREFLENVTLRVVSGVIGMTGYDLRVKDFVELDKRFTKKGEKEKEAPRSPAEQGGVGPPAADIR
jgi:hypothetical protein